MCGGVPQACTVRRQIASSRPGATFIACFTVRAATPATLQAAKEKTEQEHAAAEANLSALKTQVGSLAGLWVTQIKPAGTTIPDCQCGWACLAQRRSACRPCLPHQLYEPCPSKASYDANISVSPAPQARGLENEYDRWGPRVISAGCLVCRGHVQRVLP